MSTLTNTLSLEEKTLIYWKVSQQFHQGIAFEEGRTINVSEAFAKLNEILDTTGPDRKLVGHVINLKTDIVFRNISPKRNKVNA